jgi:hypothetical protein
MNCTIFRLRTIFQIQSLITRNYTFRIIYIYTVCLRTCFLLFNCLQMFLEQSDEIKLGSNLEVPAAMLLDT